MKPIGVISSTALFLLLGITAPANARQEKQEEKAKPAKQEQQAKPEKQQQAKGQQDQQRQPRQQQDKSAKPQQQQQAKGQQDQQRQPRQQQDKSAKPQQQQQAKGQQDQQRQPRQQQAASSQRPQRTQQEDARQRAQPAFRLSARGSGRIPDQRFRSNFGREHRFRIGNPVFVDGYSRFQYGGYWFGFVEPWPVGWYYTDDVYIDYADGGYYMYDPYYPGARFAITVVI